MRVTITDAEVRLDELVSRAEAGDEVILTRDGRPAAQLVPVTTVVRPARDAVALRALIEEVQSMAAETAIPGPSAACSQDFLYDKDGLPD